MTKTDVLLWSRTLAMLVGGLLVSGVVPDCASAADRPNVVLVMADDLGIGDITPTNPDCKIKTPNLQRMANEGITFLDAHTPSSVCTPTRYGLLTGRYNWRSRLARGVLGGTSAHLIPAERPTLGHLMRRAGYHTAMLGKWHLGWDWHKNGKKIDFTQPVKNGPDINGFDQYYGHCGSLDMPPYVWVDTGHVTAQPDRVEGVTRNQDRYGWYRKGPIGSDFHINDVLPHLFGKAITHIRQHAVSAKSGKPFFLYLALPAPHTPIVPIAPFKGSSGLNPYADFVVQVDHHVGQLFAALKEAGLDENTLVIFTSDNGCSPEANFELLKSKGHDPSAGYRGHKADIYEGGHRVPLIVRWPGHVKGGRKTKTLACLTDVYSTLEELTEQPRKPLGGEDGFSLLGVLKGAESSGRDTLISHSINGKFAIRQGAWKLCLAPGSGGWSEPRDKTALAQGLPPMQLFNLDEDPGEQKNLVGQHPEKVTALLALLDQQIQNGRCTPGKAVSNDRKIQFLPKGVTLVSRTPRVLMIGDSISGQYREYVTKNLGNRADVLWLEGKNGGDTKRAIGDTPKSSLEDWLAVADGDWDAITFNYGLHDIKFNGYKMTNKQVCSPEEYKINLRYIIERLRKTGARLLWVTITPLRGSSEGSRIPGDEVVFNEAALEVLAEYPEIMIADLYVSSLAHLDQQDGVHFTKPAGKQRAADLISGKIEIMLDLPLATRSPGNAVGSDGLERGNGGTEQDVLERKTVQCFKDGSWTDCWRHDYSYDENGVRTSELARYNKHGRWKNAYRVKMRYERNGLIDERVQQVWRTGRWVNYHRDAFSHTKELMPAMSMRQEWAAGQWRDMRKKMYAYDSNHKLTVIDSYAKVRETWQKILSSTIECTGGKRMTGVVTAKLGDEWVSRYRYRYVDDRYGHNIETLTERFHGGKWVKSSEYKCDSKKDDEELATLSGWSRGANDWETVYKIERDYNDVGGIVREQYQEKLVAIGLGDVPLLEKTTEYDDRFNAVEDVVFIAIRNASKWKCQPGTRQIYRFGRRGSRSDK